MGPYLNYFFINVFRVNSNIVASMFFFEGIWDTINDPLMGMLVDRTRTRWGKLRPYLLGVPLPLGLTTIAICAGPTLLTNPSENALSKAVYMCVTYMLWESLFTVSDVPFWGMSAAISPSTKDRTRVITAARFLSSFFNGLPGFVIPLLIDISKASETLELKEVFLAIGLISGLVGSGLMLLAGIHTRERVFQSSKEPTFEECVKCVVNNPPMQLLMARSIIHSFSGICSSFSTYFYLDVLGSASYSIIVGLPSAVTNLVAYGIIPLFKKRMNNKQILYASQTINSFLNLAAYLCGFRNYSKPSIMVPIMMIKQGLEALLYGVESVVPTEMIGETVDYAEWKTGQRSEGINFSVQTFITKFSSTISRSLGAFLLKPIGYRTSPGKVAVAQSEKTKQGIWFMFMASPIIFRLLSIFPLRFYDLVGDKRDQMFRELAALRIERNALNETEKVKSK